MMLYYQIVLVQNDSRCGGSGFSRIKTIKGVHTMAQNFVMVTAIWFDIPGGIHADLIGEDSSTTILNEISNSMSDRHACSDKAVNSLETDTPIQSFIHRSQSRTNSSTTWTLSGHLQRKMLHLREHLLQSQILLRQKFCLH